MVFGLGFCAFMNLLVGDFVDHGSWVMLISFTGVAQTKLVRRASLYLFISTEFGLVTSIVRA